MPTTYLRTRDVAKPILELLGIDGRLIRSIDIHIDGDPAAPVQIRTSEYLPRPGDDEPKTQQR